MTDEAPAASVSAERQDAESGTAAFVTAVFATNTQHLTAAQLPTFILATEQLISQLHAIQMTAIAHFARPGRAGSIDALLDMLTTQAGMACNTDGVANPVAVRALMEEHGRSMAAAEIAAVLHQSPIGASRRVDTAMELSDELPATLAALRTGLIDLSRAKIIAERTRNLDQQLRTAVEQSILPLATSRTPGQLIPLLDRRVIAADPAAAFKRNQKARLLRSIIHRPEADGMGSIQALLSAENALIVFDLLNRIAQTTADLDDRPIAARRADALTDICSQLLLHGNVTIGNALHASQHSPAEPAREPGSAPAPITGLSQVRTHHGRGTHFNLTMTLQAYLGLCDDPADLTGHGTITAQLARSLKSSMQSLAVIVLNPDGHATAIGSTVYTPDRRTTSQVIAAAGTCRFISCRMPASSCDLDHRNPFDHNHPVTGGPTQPWNLDPLCRRHHLLKTHTDWSGERSPDDGLTMIWTSPTGHQYRDHPLEFALPEDSAGTIAAPLTAPPLAAPPLTEAPLTAGLLTAELLNC